MLAERLKIARRKTGLSLRDLAGRLDPKVSAQAISKYESGKMLPSSAVLVSLAEVLDVSLDFLTSSQVSELGNVEFRKGARTRAGDAARVEAAVIDAVERYLSIEAVLDLPSEDNVLADRNRGVAASFQDAENLADCLRQSWQLGLDPIPSVTQLLEGHGLKVLVLPMPDGFSGLTCDVARTGNRPAVPVIVVNATLGVERRRFTLAHELAHRLVDNAADGADEEKVMHRFASAFLMPASSIRAELGTHRSRLAYEEILRVKRYFGVSAGALVIRMRDLGIVDADYVTYLFQTRGRTWRRRGGEPDPIAENGDMGVGERPQRFERLVYRALAENMISLPKAAGLLNRSLNDVEREFRGPAVVDAPDRQ